MKLHKNYPNVSNMYTNPIILHIKSSHNEDLFEIVESCMERANLINFKKGTEYIFEIEKDFDNMFFIFEIIKYKYSNINKSKQKIAYIQFNKIADGYSIEFFTSVNFPSNPRMIVLEIVKFFLTNFSLIEPITEIEYYFLTFMNPEKILHYEIENKDLPKDEDGMSKYRMQRDGEIMSQPESENSWNKIPDHDWDRNALELWWNNYTCKEIGEKLNISEKRIRNRLTELRKEYETKIVPYQTDLRKMRQKN